MRLGDYLDKIFRCYIWIYTTDIFNKVIFMMVVMILSIMIVVTFWKYRIVMIKMVIMIVMFTIIGAGDCKCDDDQKECD